jgi:transcriptional regulator with XRE-family HTH domain
VALARLNGIVTTPDGAHLVSCQTNLGRFWRISLRDGQVDEVALKGGPLEYRCSRSTSLARENARARCPARRRLTCGVIAALQSARYVRRVAVDMAVAHAPAGRASIGELLRAWRHRRSLSQLELALEADVSSRHVSFLETGRAKPSREMVLRLAEHLDIPLRERNRLLVAAGYAPLYVERSLEEPEMTPVHRALDRFLRAHEPYPAVVLDRHYNLVSANDALGIVTAGVAPELLAPPANALRVTLHPRGMAPRILNLTDWSAHLLHRLRRQAALTADPELEALHDELASYPGVSEQSPREDGSGSDIVLPLRLRAGDRELAFFSTVSTFGTPVDITLAELMIEAFYPANAATASYLLQDIAGP